MNRTEQNRTEQNRTEQNRTDKSFFNDFYITEKKQKKTVVSEREKMRPWYGGFFVFKRSSKPTSCA